MNTDQLLPSVYEIYALGQSVKWVGEPTLTTYLLGIENGTEGVVVGHNYPGNCEEAAGRPILIRFDSCPPRRVLPVYMNVSPRDIMPI